MVFILIPIKKIESVTEFTVFTFWQVLNETYSSFNSNYALKLIRAPEFGIAKYLLKLICVGLRANVCTNQFISHSLMIDVYGTLKESTL